MGKRRNAKYKSVTAGEVSSTGATYGGGSSKDDKFSVFEFADDDLRVETESRKTLAKFGTRSPSKKPAHHHQSVDKYFFLEYCKSVPARIIVFGTLKCCLLDDGVVVSMLPAVLTGDCENLVSCRPVDLLLPRSFQTVDRMWQNDSENDFPDVDVTDGVPTDRTFEMDVKISPGSLNYKSHAFSVLKHQVFESPCVSKSCEQGNTKPGGCTTGTNHNEVFNVDSDEDERMEFRSPSSSFALADNAGSLKEQSSDCRSRSNDCEAVVVVAPKYVKYGDRCIRLEGSPLGETKRLYYLEWPTFNISKIEYQKCESLNQDWFHPAEVSLRKRDHIRKVIHRIVEDKAMKDASAVCNNQGLQSGMNEGDSSAHSLQENDVKESCLGIEFPSSDNYEIKEQQSFRDILGQRTSHKELVPINQFRNMRLPMEGLAGFLFPLNGRWIWHFSVEGPEKQATSPECTMNRYRADEDDKTRPSHCLLSSFRMGEIKASQGTSKTCTGKSPIIIDLQNDEDCVPEAASALKRDKERNDDSSMSSEDLATCVVEDSEEEYETSESVRINRRPTLLISPIRIIKKANYANTVS
ncbi:UNVERIFIED_CONTAM: hypothetical protein Sindi_0241600 [Sesamum indicum]